MFNLSRGRLRFAAVQVAAFVILSLLVRGILLSSFGPLHASSAGELLRVFAVGFHLDCAVGLAIFLPLVLWLTLIPDRWLVARWQRRLLWAGCWIWWGLIIFLAISEYFFFKEYLSRFNTVAIDYIHYWTEVSGNIREMYPVNDIVAACVLGAAVVVFLSWNLAPPAPGVRLARRLIGGGLWIIAAAALSSAVSLREIQLSSERALNEISSNGLVSGLVALLTRDLDYKAFYRTVSRDEAFKLARELTADRGKLSDDPYSLQRAMPGDPSKPKLNVVVLLEESFGSEFWGILNDKEKGSLTPRLDELAKKDAWLFSNLYADGNRTIRGMEGILASFPPLPGDSILARTRTRGCETLAQVLARDGYSTTFVYPGRGFFDGLRPFALDNGFERFIEQKDFEKPTFSTVWGVCNEDLYDRVLDEMRTMHQSGKPFFVAALSVSNHQPFTYPDGRIKEPAKAHSRKNAVKYVDYALGRFFDMARKEVFWKDTIFVVIADHGARVYGSQTIPIRSYEIPLLIAGPAVVDQPKRINTLGCQLDVAPTILGLIGRPYTTTFFGHDLLRTPPGKERVLLHHNRSIGIYRDQRLVILGLNKTIEYFRGDPKTGKFERVPDADEISQQLEREAVAIFQVADDLYTGERYKVVDPQPLVGGK